jgi:hypothetical protein
MNMNEYKNGIKKDIPFLCHKINECKKIFCKEVKNKNNFFQLYKKLFSFVTNNGNKGYIVMITPSYGQRLEPYFLIYFLVNTNIGEKLVSLFLTPTNEIKKLNIFSAHFFERYIERLNLDISHNEAIKHFILNNENIIGGVVKEKQLIGILNNGIAIGSYENEDCYYNTFISKEMSQGKQTYFQTAINEIQNKLSKKGCNVW